MGGGEKKLTKKKIKSRPFAFHASEAPKRIRNNWALGILSSVAIRLSWWSERDEWQGSRPSPGFTQQGVFLPSSPLSSSPFSRGRYAAEIFPDRRQCDSRRQILSTGTNENEEVKKGAAAGWERTHTRHNTSTDVFWRWRTKRWCDLLTRMLLNFVRVV